MAVLGASADDGGVLRRYFTSLSREGGREGWEELGAGAGGQIFDSMVCVCVRERRGWVGLMVRCEVGYVDGDFAFEGVDVSITCYL